MRWRLIVTALVIGGCAVGSALAAGSKDDREHIMKQIAGATGALAAIAKGEKPYDAGTVQTALTTISTNAKAFPEQFPPGSDSGDKAASPEIWKNFADFKAKAEKLSGDAEMILAQLPADPAAVGGALKTLGASCGGCHKVYRLKD